MKKFIFVVLTLIQGIIIIPLIYLIHICSQATARSMYVGANVVTGEEALGVYLFYTLIFGILGAIIFIWLGITKQNSNKMRKLISEDRFTNNLHIKTTTNKELIDKVNLVYPKFLKRFNEETSEDRCNSIYWCNWLVTNYFPEAIIVYEGTKIMCGMIIIGEYIIDFYVRGVLNIKVAPIYIHMNNQRDLMWRLYGDYGDWKDIDGVSITDFVDVKIKQFI